MGRMKTYGFKREGDTITFMCDDEKILKDIEDYITRYIDAENYRNTLKRVSTERI